MAPGHATSAAAVFILYCFVLPYFEVGLHHRHPYVSYELSDGYLDNHHPIFFQKYSFVDGLGDFSSSISSICIKTIGFAWLKQWPFSVPKRKFLKSNLRYYPNTDASFNIEKNPGPPQQDESLNTNYRYTGNKDCPLESQRISAYISNRMDNYIQFTQPNYYLSRQACLSNLIAVPRTLYITPQCRFMSTNVKFYLLDTRSVRNKAMTVKDHAGHKRPEKQYSKM